MGSGGSPEASSCSEMLWMTGTWVRLWSEHRTLLGECVRCFDQKSYIVPLGRLAWDGDKA